MEIIKDEKQSSKALSKLIGSIGKQNTKLRGDIQTACLMAIGHAVLFGQVTPGTQLMEATTGTVRRQAIVNFLSEFGPFSWDAKENKFSKNKKWERCTVEGLSDWLDSVPLWYEFTKESAIKPYDFFKDFESLLGRAQKHIEKGEKVGNLELLTELSDVMQRFKASKPGAVAPTPEEPADPVTEEIRNLIHQRTGTNG